MQSSGMNAIVKLLPSCQQGLFVSQSHKSLNLFVFCLFVDHIKSPIGSNLLVAGSQVFDCLLSCLLLERLWLFIVWLLLITIAFTDQQCKFKTPVTMVIASKVADPGVFRDVAEPGSSVVSLGVVEMAPGLHSGNSDKRPSSKMRNISLSLSNTFISWACTWNLDEPKRFQSYFIKNCFWQNHFKTSTNYLY